ncbi:MAG: DoxX family protein [Chlorobi bacterium]|jgi:uncharacterized membrane protein YphA (DoxX/SURF4 family)|nr:DoxX family protein [Chlorobiota bacterium]
MDQTVQRDGSHGAAAAIPVAATPAVRLADHPAMRWLSLGVRVVLGVIFLVAGAEKLVALPTFGHSIADYQLLPESLSNIFALSFVWTEIVVGVLLLAGVAIRGSALVTAAMLIVFLVAVISAIARGMTIDCGCFAGKSEPVGPKKVIEDLLLLAAALFLIYFPNSYLTLSRLLRREWELGER